MESNQDFVTLNKDGIQVVALGSQQKKVIKDAEGNERIIHSLDSCSYLKLDRGNTLIFANQKIEKREIHI